MGCIININCQKIDRLNRCHHPSVPNEKFLWFQTRPICKLILQPKESIDKDGNVSYDDKCKYQTKYPKPKLMKETN